MAASGAACRLPGWLVPQFGCDWNSFTSRRPTSRGQREFQPEFIINDSREVSRENMKLFGLVQFRLSAGEKGGKRGQGKRGQATFSQRLPVVACGGPRKSSLSPFLSLFSPLVPDARCAWAGIRAREAPPARAGGASVFVSDCPMRIRPSVASARTRPGRTRPGRAASSSPARGRCLRRQHCRSA